MGHFRSFRIDFRAQSKRLGPVWSLFLTNLASKNDLNGPNSGTQGQSITILYWLGPLVAIFSHFGQFPSDFRTQSKRLGPIRSLFLTHLATQNDVGQSGTEYYHTVLVGDLWGPFWTISGHLRLILGPSAKGLGLFGAYFSPVWTIKMT